jgi:hypothetical protein
MNEKDEMSHSDVKQTIKDLQYMKSTIGPKLQLLLDEMNAFQSKLDAIK